MFICVNCDIFPCPLVLGLVFGAGCHKLILEDPTPPLGIADQYPMMKRGPEIHGEESIEDDYGQELS
jgi:hypothetical protein